MLVYQRVSIHFVFANAAYEDAGTFSVFLTSDVSRGYGYGAGWGDVNVLVNLHAFWTLRPSRGLGWVGGGVG
jgi:hypothetical protein